MARTYLQLVQRLAVEAGASGSIVTCQGQTGEAARLCTWIQDAYRDVQEVHEDWGFLLQPVSFATVAQQATYTPTQCGLTDFGYWKRGSFRTYITSGTTSTEVFLADSAYNDWRDMYQFGALRTTYMRPVTVAISPYDKSLCLGPVPDSTGYTVVGEYFRKPFELVNDTDTPVIPDKFQMIIVWRALTYYALYEGAPEALQRGQTEFNRLMRMMEADQLPVLVAGDPLA